MYFAIFEPVLQYHMATLKAFFKRLMSLRDDFKYALRALVLVFLNWLARVRLRRLDLFVIGVTGSIGKTSTKEALCCILEKQYRVLKSAKSYNTEFGLPLTILEQSSGFSSPFLWIKALLGGFFKAFFGGRHLQILVLEMGVDKPGDMSDLLEVVHPQMGILTNIKPVHLGAGQFKDQDDIFLEKSKLIRALPDQGVAILNGDDPYVASLKITLEGKSIWYGCADWVDVRATKVQGTPKGLEFAITYKNETVEGFIPALGDFQIYVVLAAVATAVNRGFTLQDAVKALGDYRLPPGRMNIIEGIKGATIIDSSYNASPESMKEALEILGRMPGRKIAVLGNMNELGTYAEAKHREVGNFINGKADLLISVGDYAKLIGQEAVKQGFSADHVKHFEDPLQAGEYLHTLLKKDDTVLVKGSQNKVRLERLIKMVMKHPERAKEILVRQDETWQHIT